MNDSRQKRYVWRISLIFMLTQGTVMWDRFTISQASDIIMDALSLSSVQFSALTALSTASFAVSSVLSGVISDKTGWRKRMLAPYVCACGIISLGCAMCNSYSLLLALRILAGFAEGPTLMFMMAILSKESHPDTLGRNNGIVMAGVAIIGNTIGPVAVTRIATAFNWGSSFFITGFLQIALAVCITLFVREVREEKRIETEKATFTRLLGYRNFVIACFIGILSMICFWSCTLFAPIYLSSVCGMEPSERGIVSSVMGAVYIVAQLAVPALSDRVGRKPALITVFILGMFSPLTMWLAPASGLSVICYCAFGGLISTTTSVYANVILMETLPDDLKTSASGIVLGLAELIGGVAWPLSASSIFGDADGVTGIMMITSLLFVLAAILSAFFIETNKRRRKVA